MRVGVEGKAKKRIIQMYDVHGLATYRDKYTRVQMQLESSNDKLTT